MQLKTEKELKAIENIQKEVIILGDTASLVRWDQATNMPIAGVHDCSKKLSLLSELAHKRFTSDELKNSVKSLLKPANFSSLDKKDQVIIKRLNKDVEKASKLPPEFVAKLAALTSEAVTVWQEAKKKNRFKMFQPYLEKVVEMKREECRLRNIPGHPYNSLIDIYEEGMTVERLKETFEPLEKELVLLLKKVKESSLYKDHYKIRKPFDAERQAELCKGVIKLLNMPEDKTRIDISAHPFTTSIGREDVRITTRYNISHPLQSLLSTMHEAGHALYELGLPKRYEYTVIYNAPSFGLHESQSRFWENMIGKSESFWKYFYPIYKEKFKEQLKGISFEDWFRNVNYVEPSFIRTEADELTYCLHIILRFEIEMKLIEGNIQVKELPEVWNEKFDKIFGIKPKKDSEGILQDIHWSWGDFGYFPSYALGSIYASQLYARMAKEYPSIEKDLEQGKLSNALLWLRENVHKYGRSLTAEETIRKVCKEGLNPKVYIDYLNEKYSKIYKFH